MKRIVIVGATGTGKTRLGQQLAQSLNLPLIDIDDLRWLPDWQQRAREDFIAKVTEAIDRPEWIFTGDTTSVREKIVARADTLIWLDYPFWVILWRLVRRSLFNIRHRTFICNGNQESWSQFLSRRSIVVWLFKSFRIKRRDYGTIFAHPQLLPQTALVHLRSPKACKEFLQRLS